jgi:hypothetical protein
MASLIGKLIPTVTSVSPRSMDRRIPPRPTPSSHRIDRVIARRPITSLPRSILMKDGGTLGSRATLRARVDL